eukprot:CAMPEP_0201583856 /NCGR_PEP_ID=MMETSP0190_2-20130828/103668_1 /ASSEMBLY_ACC=CAM_ASM_000263 /TAXON_ID=37353 /ORGANISM="Rosalina sp." /LENGTH=268 /DNA_ID=CAMNT_0048026627 /DNA_START=24 /DNA_END=830 /DNA_ORIENTATION=+
MTTHSIKIHTFNRIKIKASSNLAETVKKTMKKDVMEVLKLGHFRNEWEYMSYKNAEGNTRSLNFRVRIKYLNAKYEVVGIVVGKWDFRNNMWQKDNNREDYFTIDTEDGGMVTGVKVKDHLVWQDIKAQFFDQCYNWMRKENFDKERPLTHQRAKCKFDNSGGYVDAKSFGYDNMYNIYDELDAYNGYGQYSADSQDTYLANGIKDDSGANGIGAETMLMAIPVAVLLTLLCVVIGCVLGYFGGVLCWKYQNKKKETIEYRNIEHESV